MSKASKFSFIALHFVSFSEQTPSRVSHHQIRWIVSDTDASAVKSPTPKGEKGELSLSRHGRTASWLSTSYLCMHSTSHLYD